MPKKNAREVIEIFLEDGPLNGQRITVTNRAPHTLLLNLGLSTYTYTADRKPGPGKTPRRTYTWQPEQEKPHPRIEDT